MKQLRKYLLVSPLMFLSACSENVSSNISDSQKSGSEVHKPSLEMMEEALGDSEAIYPNIQILSTNNGCSAMTENFCDQLYDKDHLGNADFRVDETNFTIRFGDNPKGFKYSEDSFQRARWLARKNLPQPLLGLLESQRYFDLMRKYLNTKPVEVSTLEEVKETYLLSHETSAIWDWAVGQTVLEHVEREVPSFHTAKYKPRSWEVTRNKVTKRVKSEIYKAIWEKNPLWLKAVNDFRAVQKAFIETLEEDLNLSTDIRRSWKDLILSIRAVPPGSDPEHLDEDCARSERNAFYLGTKHYFTVCGGLLGTTDITGIIAHELSHALGVGHLMLEHNRRSAHWAKMKILREQVCAPVSSRVCPSQWEDFKATYADSVTQVVSSFQPPVPKFLACLQYSEETIKSELPDPSYLKRVAETRSRQMVSALATSTQFLEMSKPTLTLANDTESENPFFLNPCGYSNWAESSYDVGTVWDLLFFYSAAYLCSDKNKSPEERLDHSITEARDVYSAITQQLIPMGGRFSKDDEMTAQGYSEDSEERFADNIGYRVFARMLRSSPPEIRKARFLANLSFFCNEPSPMKKYPRELQKEKTHSLESHSAGLQRRREIQIKAIREAIGCEKDFDLKECELDQPE